MKKILLSLLAVFIIAANPVVAATVGDTFEKVESTESLTINDEYILCYDTNAMGALNGKYYSRVEKGITLNGNTATISDGAVNVFKIVEGTATGTYAFQNEDGKYFTCTNITNNNLGASTTLITNSNLSITIASGVATIIPTEHSNNNSCKIQYNSNSGQERFSNYKTGTQKNCTLYKKVTVQSNVATPEITCENNTVTISIDEKDKDAAIYYTTDTTEPTAESTLYEAPFAITASCTVKAIAIKNGESSEVATFECVYEKPAEPEAVTSNPAAVDGIITVVRGTEITFTSAHAAKLKVDIEADNTTTSTDVEGNTYTYTATQPAMVTITPYNSNGELITDLEALFMVDFEAAPLCGEIVFNPASGSEITEGTEVTISCENAAKITYIIATGETVSDPVTVDGNEAKVTVTEACTIEAEAENADGVKTEKAYEASYTVVAAPTKATFDFTKDDIIGISDKSTLEANNGTTENGTNNLDGVTFTLGSVSMKFAKTGTETNPRYWGTTPHEVRIYKNSTITIRVADGCTIKSISFTQTDKFNGFTSEQGTWTSITEWSAETTARAANTIQEIVLTASDQNRFTDVTVNYEQTETGVGSIAVDNENAPVEYYNMQGIRVENPTAGLYIRRQGNTASKVFIR